MAEYPRAFQRLDDLYRPDIRVLDDTPEISVRFAEYDVRTGNEPALTGRYPVTEVEGIDRLDPSYGEFCDEYARSVMVELDRFTDLDMYLARRGIRVDGVNDDLYTTVRAGVEQILGGD